MANMMSAQLRKVLMALSPEGQARVAERWAATDLFAEYLPGMEESSERGLLHITSARFAWEALSLDARQVLHQLIQHGVMDGVPREDLQALSELASAEFVAALQQLEQNMMLIEVRPDSKVRQRLEERGRKAPFVLAVPKDFHSFFATIHQEIYGPVDRSEMSLVDFLSTLDSSQLLLINNLTMTPMGGSTFAFYPSASYSSPTSIAGRLVQPSLIEILWQRLDTNEQELCRSVCQAGGHAEMAQLQAELKLSRPQIAHHMNQLSNAGLIFEAFCGQEYRLFVGRGTFKVLRTLIKEIDEERERAQHFSVTIETGEAPPYVEEAQGILLFDLAVVVNAVYQMVIEPTQAGYVPKRLANKIAPLLHGNRYTPYDGSDHYLDMVFEVANALKLIQIQESPGQKSRYLPGPDLKNWTQMEAFEQARTLLRAWEDVLERSWSDVAGLHFHNSSYGYSAYIEAMSSRSGLLHHLHEECQPGKWYAMTPFLQTIKARKPLLLRENSRYSSYGHGNSRKSFLENWNLLDGEIIIGLLSSSLHEMGLVSLGYQRDPALNKEDKDNPDAFQFTELAAQTMWDQNLPEVHAQGHGRALIVQPNFELLLLQADYPTLYQLLPFVKVEQIELVSRLILTQESVRRGVEAGYSVGQIIQTLQEYSQKDLPQNVLYTLQDWGRLYKNATVSQTILIEVGNESVADELCASAKLRTLELRRLGPLAIAIGGQVSLQVLRTTLEKEGIILHIEGNILNAREYASALTRNR